MTPDEIHEPISQEQVAEKIIDPGPDRGMNNYQWAKKLLNALVLPLNLEEELNAQFIEQALTIACCKSKRPADRLAENCLIPGHDITAKWRNSMVLQINCHTCPERYDIILSDTPLLSFALDKAGIKFIDETPDGS